MRWRLLGGAASEAGPMALAVIKRAKTLQPAVDTSEGFNR